MFSDPEKNIGQLFLREGMSVADLGAGSGAYTFAAAKKVGDKGRVYAVEVQKDMVAKVKNEAVRLGLGNVEALWGDIEELGGSKLAENSVDAVIVANVFFQVEDKNGLLAEAKRVLRPGGKVFFVDWADSFGGLGPHKDEVVTQSEAKKILGDAGLAHEKDFDAGEHHYGMIFTK